MWVVAGLTDIIYNMLLSVPPTESLAEFEHLIKSIKALW